MDKLKENAFEIMVGAVGVALLGLLFLFVIRPLGDLGAEQDKIEKDYQSLDRLLKANRKEIPTVEVKNALEQKDLANREALRNALAYYEEQALRFTSYFPGAGDPPELSWFIAQYNDQLKSLIEGYQKKYNIQINPEDPDEIYPKVSRFDPTDAMTIAVAQKEFWMTQAIFEACDALEIRGLREIEFPGRLAAASKDSRPYRKYQKVTAKIDMPYSKLENLVTLLFSNPKVPFLLEDLTVEKTQEQLGQYLAIEKRVDFEDQAAASRADYDALVPEPDCVVTLQLEAMEWTGIPKEQLNLEE